MNFTFSVALAVVGVAAAWANEPVAALHPLVSKDSAVFEPALVGTWDSDIKIVADRTGYRVKLDKEWCTLQLMRFHGMLLGDLRFGKESGLAVHIFMALRLEGDDLQVRFLGTKWLEDNIRSVGWPRFETVDDDSGPGILLLASTAELQ